MSDDKKTCGNCGWCKESRYSTENYGYCMRSAAPDAWVGHTIYIKTKDDPAPNCWEEPKHR